MIVLVTIDTMRADHSGSFGYPLDTTPFLDSLARQGVLFKKAFSQSATTAPAHSSIFTSLYPLQHGVVSNALELGDEFLTAAELLHGIGYRTAAFVSIIGPLRGNLSQGFEVFGEEESPPDEKAHYRPAEETVSAALDWLRGRELSDRVFLWVHLYDPHNPLRPPPEHLEWVEKQIAEYGKDRIREVWNQQGVRARAARAREKLMAYDAELHYVDAELRRLHNGVRDLGLNRNALWVITSDHGQGLGAHRWWGHTVQIYNAQLHVPLLFHFSDGRFPPTQVDDRIVEHVDILPTIAELVGASLDAQILPVQGHSLLPYLVGENSTSAKRYAFSERTRYTRRSARPGYEPGERYALQDLELKFIRFTEGEDEFYDLREDPYEFNNLVGAPAYGDRVEEFGQILDGLVVTLRSGVQAEEVDPEVIERLRALGYLGK
jgi:arylsulfatase A-like enzyme